MECVRWGVIGCGNVCEVKAGPPLYSVARSELLAVTRRDAAKGEDYVRRHGHGVYVPSIDALLAISDIDAVYVATPDAFHEEPTIRAAEAGKHVLVEKAMAPNTAACDRMIAACRDAKVSLGVAYYRRCFPTVVRAQRLLESGLLGELKSLRIGDGFPDSHRLDLFHFFAGDLATIELREDLVPDPEWSLGGPLLHAMSRSGVACTTNPAWDSKDRTERLELIGDKGRAVITDLKAGALEIQLQGQIARENVALHPAVHWGLMENFVDHILDGLPLACDGIEGRKSTVILDLVKRLKPGSGPVEVIY